jgi:hypothetical protein
MPFEHIYYTDRCIWAYGACVAPETCFDDTEWSCVALVLIYLQNQRTQKLVDSRERTSSNGLVSLKQDSHTSFTTLFAMSSDLQDGLLRIDNIARRLTQFW